MLFRSLLWFRSPWSHSLWLCRPNSWRASLKSPTGSHHSQAVLRAHCSYPKTTQMLISGAFRMRSYRCQYIFDQRLIHHTDLRFCRPDSGAATILIGRGEYHEVVNVSRKAPLTLLVRRNPLLCISRYLTLMNSRGN